MATEEKQDFIAETVESYEKYYNRGFISYRKSVTQAGQFAALEWSGQAFMCSRDKEFTIKGTENCLTRGFDRTGFFEVDTGEQRAWTVQLTESNEQPAQQRVPGIPGTVGPGGAVPGLPNQSGGTPPGASGLPPAASPGNKQ